MFDALDSHQVAGVLAGLRAFAAVPVRRSTAGLSVVETHVVDTYDVDDGLALELWSDGSVSIAAAIDDGVAEVHVPRHAVRSMARRLTRKGNDHWKLQPRDKEGDDAGRWVESPQSAVKSLLGGPDMLDAILSQLRERDDPRPELTKLKIGELKELLDHVGLSSKGYKSDLVGRLVKHVAGVAPDAKAKKAPTTAWMLDPKTDKLVKVPVDEVPDGLPSFPTKKAAQQQVGRDTLAELEKGGLVAKDAEGNYHLTQAGRDVDLKAFQAAQKAAGNESVRPAGAGPLGEVPAGRVPGDEGSGDVLPDAGRGDRVPDQRPGGGPGGPGADGSTVPGPDAGHDGGPDGGDLGSAAGDAADGRGGRDGADGRVVGPVFRPTGQEDLAPATEKRRLAANLEALRTLRAIQAQGRPATADEQSVLARWSAWGALPGVFKRTPPDKAYAAAQEELKGLLSPAEFAAARRTTRNAHYTDAGYVGAIWDAVHELGFTGGEVLEPGSGSGTFMGLVPADIAPDTHVTGVELDPVTAAISRALYPNQDVRTESFADTKVPDGSFDAAIGNVPFSNTKLFDPDYNPGRRNNMHNHFIVKSLRMTRPGGLTAVITSRYTMDSQNPSARQEMAELGDLVGAVRLPSGAHERAAGTTVVTDLLIFRRREPGTPYAGLPFEETRKVQVDGKDIAINEHFLDADGNPTDMVLGTLGAMHGMKGRDDLTVKGDKAAEPALRAALDKVAARARVIGQTQTPGHQGPPAFAATGRARMPDGYTQALADGTFTRLVGGIPQPYKPPAVQADELRHLLRLRDTVLALVDVEAGSSDDTDEMKRLRTELNDLYDSYVANPKWGPVSRYTQTRAKGSTDADDIEEEKVTRRRPPQGGFRSDPYSAAVRALEIYDPATGTARKTEIFERRGITPRSALTAADSPADALAISMDQNGEVDLDYIADLLASEDTDDAREALGTLVYDEPGTDRLVPAAEYLSGNVREKLERARELAGAGDSTYEANVEALARVLPVDLTATEIRARMGAGWIEPRYVQQFLREILRDRTLTVRRTHGSDWDVKGDKRSGAATVEWGTRERSAVELAEDILTQRPIQVRMDDELSQDKTEEAEAKAREIAERFEAWAWEDPTRQRDLQTTYNRLFNSLVLRSYDGSKMSLPGLSEEGFYPYPHRFAAIRRIVAEPSVGLWHDVGAGKTTVMIAAAMEMRRLGLVNKPAIVVPNHMLAQMSGEFLERYPQARVLGIASDDLKNDPDGQKRREVIARAATGDWDAVILTQGAFKRLPVSVDTETSYMESEIEPLRRSIERRRAEVETQIRADNPGKSERDIAEAVHEALDGKKGDPTVKELEGLVEKAENAVKEHVKTAKRDAGLTFEQTGIDYLFVDEAHTYKNLRTTSRVPNMGIPGSKIATDLHMKLHHLRTKYDRVATLATATPIANSVGEAYTMMRYLRPDLLVDMGVDTFDDFASSFGEVVSRLEVAPTGGLRQHPRFSRFINLPEFLRPWLIASDVQTAEQLKDIVKVPALAERIDADGHKVRTPETVVVPPSQELKDYMATLVKRANNIEYPPRKGGDNMLRITGEGRAAALDLQMVGRKTDEATKLDVAADRIAGIYTGNKDRVYTSKDGNPVGVPGALQLVFSDIGTPSSGKKRKPAAKAGADETPESIEDAANEGLAKFTAYEALKDKLEARGVPRSKVRFIHEAGTDQEKAELFAAARDGRIAVLIGSTAKMGVGTNVQDRAIALHHLDAPWRPADVQQREGRIVRQGNKNPEVEVIRYVTEQSFDAYIWQAITTKGTFINQIMRGQLDVREMDDIGEFALSAATVTALGTGNRWLIEHTDAQADATRLEREARRHQAGQDALPSQIAAADKDAATSDRLTAETDAAIAKRVDTHGKNFKMTVDGTALDSRSEAAKHLKGALYRVSRDLDRTESTIGELGGFPIRAGAISGGGVRVGLVGVPGSSFNYGSDGIATADIIWALERALDDLDKVRGRHVKRAQEARDSATALRARVGRPFPDAEKLKAARERLERVQAQLQAELAKRGETLEIEDPAAKAAARQGEALADIRRRLDSGQGFKGIGELTTWLEADPALVDQIPSDAGKKWGVLSPGGQLIVMKDTSYEGGYRINAPRTMQSMKALAGFRTQTTAKQFAEILEGAGIPWNSGAKLAAWRGPDGADVIETVARLRGESKAFDPKGAWRTVAAEAAVTRRTPKRLRKQLLDGRLGAAVLAKLPPERREEILAILNNFEPDGDLALAARLREYGLADGVEYQAQNFALSAAKKLDQDYRTANPQPLDSVRKRFASEFGRIYSDVDQARIDQILAEADVTGDLTAAVAKLRALEGEYRAKGRPYSNELRVAGVFGDLADYLARRAELAANVTVPDSPADLYPQWATTPTQRLLVDFFRLDSIDAAVVDAAMRDNAPEGWPGNFMKERAVRRALKHALPDDFGRLDELMDLLRESALSLAAQELDRELVGARSLLEQFDRRLN